MKALLIVVLLAGCATQPEWPEGQVYKLSPQTQEKCKAKGGGAVLTAEWFLTEMLRAFKAGQGVRVPDKQKDDSL